MTTSKPTVLGSLQLAEQLLQEIKQHKTTNQSKEKKYLPVLSETLCRQYTLELSQTPENWHQFDALLAYISGLRFQSGIHQTFGDPEEGQIVI